MALTTLYNSGLPLERDDSMYRGKSSNSRIQVTDVVIKTRSAKVKEQGPVAIEVAPSRTTDKVDRCVFRRLTLS